MDDRKLTAGLLGAGSAAVFSLVGSEQDFRDRLRELKRDKRDLDVRLNHLLASGDWLRLGYSTVRDALTGLAAAHAQAQQPSAIPQPWTAINRPDLSSEANVAALSWPPLTGQYDATGRTGSAGQLALTFYALTYQEPRAWIQGLAQAESPSATACVQLYRAANSLSTVASEQSLTAEEWRSVWRRLFAGVDTKPGFLGRSESDSPRTIGVLPTSKDGIYTVEASCGIQREDGVGGSLRIAATYSKFRGALALVRSDRLLAQLHPQLVGVSADFVVATESRIALEVRGKPAMILEWDNQMTLRSPI